MPLRRWHAVPRRQAGGALLYQIGGGREGRWAISQCCGRACSGAVGFLGRSPGDRRGQSGIPAHCSSSAFGEWPTGVGGSSGRSPRAGLSGTGIPGRHSRTPRPWRLHGVRPGRSPEAAPAGTGIPGRQRRWPRPWRLQGLHPGQPPGAAAACSGIPGERWRPCFHQNKLGWQLRGRTGYRGASEEGTKVSGGAARSCG